MDMKEPIKLVINNIVKTIEANDKIEKMDDMINLVETIIDKGNQEIQDIQEIKLTIPNFSVRNFNQISEGDKTEIMVQEEEEEEKEINYCNSCQVNTSEEQYDNLCEECYGRILQIEQMIKDDNVVDEEEDEEEEAEENEEEEQYYDEEEEKEEERKADAFYRFIMSCGDDEEEVKQEEPQQEEIKIISEPTNEIIKKKGDSDSEYEYKTDDDDKCYKSHINQHNNFFETYEYEYETEDEKLVVDQLNKFMQRFSEKEFKTYSDDKQGKFCETLRNKRMYIVNWLKFHYKQIYFLEYNGNDFFIRTLLKLIKIKMDNFVDEFGDEDVNGEEYYVINLTPQINKLINYYLLEMKELMNKCFPILVEK
jgi:hypothetical protein